MTISRALLFIALAVSAMIFSASVYKSTQRVDGYCIETGRRLSDEESSALAKMYAFQSNPLRKDPVYRDADFTVRLISSSELRDEEKVPFWVKRFGGVRGYALVNYDLAGLEKLDLQLLKTGRLLVVSNCGAVRINVRRFKWRLL
jgi:hypothetical protein